MSSYHPLPNNQEGATSPAPREGTSSPRGTPKAAPFREGSDDSKGLHLERTFSSTYSDDWSSIPQRVRPSKLCGRNPGIVFPCLSCAVLVSISSLPLALLGGTSAGPSSSMAGGRMGGRGRMGRMAPTRRSNPTSSQAANEEARHASLKARDKENAEGVKKSEEKPDQPVPAVVLAGETTTTTTTTTVTSTSATSTTATSTTSTTSTATTTSTSTTSTTTTTATTTTTLKPVDMAGLADSVAKQAVVKAAKVAKAAATEAAKGGVVGGSAMGKPVRVEDGLYDCQEFYDTWERDWTDDRKSWCCSHQNRGCQPCDFGCSWQNSKTSCKLHILAHVTGPGTCAAAHDKVLAACPVCSQCSVKMACPAGTLRDPTAAGKAGAAGGPAPTASPVASTSGQPTDSLNPAGVKFQSSAL